MDKDNIESETMESLLNWKSNKNHADDFSRWLKATEQKPLTRTEHEFSHWCFEHKKVLIQTGGLEGIFNSIRKYLRNN